MRFINEDVAITEGVLNGHLVDSRELDEKVLNSKYFTLAMVLFCGVLSLLIFAVTCLEILKDRERITKLEQEVAVHAKTHP